LEPKGNIRGRPHAGRHKGLRMGKELTDADVVELMNNPVAEIRAKLAAKVAHQISDPVLSESEREIANDILRKLSLDVALVVRETLAQHVRRAKELPNDVAMTLARDVESVALPILECSPVFTDADLVELVRIGSPAKQVAVARRETVSEVVAYAIIELENADAAVALVKNEGAALDERLLSKVLDFYGDHDDVKSAMVHRSELPLVIAEQLVAMVSDQLREYLVVHHDLPEELATEIILETRESALMKMVGDDASCEETARLVSRLYGRGRLTPSLVLRALCLGDMEFCEQAFSHLAAVPVDDARKLIHDPGPLGLQAIYERAGLPEALFPIFRLAVDVYNEIALDFDTATRQRFCQCMIERLRDEGAPFSQADRDYLISTLSRLTDAA